MRSTIFAGIILAAASLAACGGGGNSSPAVVQCTLPAGTQVALAYPISGSSGVPDSPGQVVIAASTALPNSWQVVLGLANGGLIFEGVLNTVAPSAIPTPFATPSFANPTYQMSGLTSGLPSGMAVNVFLNNQASVCNGFPQIGSFTTQ